jgi:hypothetical protein
MSVRDWLRNNETGLLGALGFLIVGALTVVVAIPHTARGPSPSKPEAASQQKSQQQRDWRPSFYPAEPYAAYHNDNCQAPKDREEADLCQQWRVAEATEKSVALADSQHWLNSLQAWSTVIAAIATAAAAIAAGYAARSSADAAKVARDALVASERAWIRRDRIVFSEPLQFASTGLLNTSVQLEFTNVGSAPAIHVNTFAWLIPDEHGTAPQQRAREHFNSVRSNPVSSGFTLFPGQAYPRDRDIPVHESVMLRPEETDTASDEVGRISLYLAACINYSFASDPDKNHQTSCMFEVRAPWPIARGADDIPETQLGLLEIAGFGGMDLAD